jgi:crotonobetainyl-CoA:carnitine CoA-transferase CaiB-like acyl-CoA transferase
MALLDVQASWLANQAMNHLIGGYQPKRRGNAHPNIVPYQDFKAKDGYVIVAVGTDDQFRKLAKLIGQPGLAEAGRYKTNRQRVEKREELIPILREAFGKKTVAEWLGLLKDLKIPAGPINDLAETYSDPQVVHRELVRTLNHPLGGTVPQVTTPIKYSKTGLEYKIPPPLLGQHTDEILAELGFHQGEIKAFRDQGVVG